MQCRLHRRRAAVALAALVCTAIYLLLPGRSATRRAGRSVLISTPGNATYPFHSMSFPDRHLTPLPVSLPPYALFPTHIERHPLAPDVYVVTNEVEQGSIVAVQVADPSKVVGTASSGGRFPAFCAVQRDRAICSNYGSPTISVHRLVPRAPFIQHLSDFTLPTHDDPAASHPHQVVFHPSIRGLAYVPDLGLNTIYVVRLDDDRVRLQGRLLIREDIGIGPRHGVVTPDAKHLIVGFQTSNTVAALPLDADGSIDAPLSSLPTLRLPGVSTHALSDIHLSTEGTVYVLNRQVAQPYRGEGDTVALFRMADGRLESGGSIQLPCWQPREMLPLGEETFVVSCTGADGLGTGAVLLQDGAVVDHWKGESSWGLSVL